MRMITLSLHQPWALFVVLGLKRNETRWRKVNFRGPFCIHATKKWEYWQIDYLASAVKTFKLDDSYGSPIWELGHNQDLFGAVIGDAFLESCHSTDETFQVSVQEKYMGDYGPGRYFYTLSHPNFYVAPTPARGYTGWWYWENNNAVTQLSRPSLSVP